MNPKSFWKLLAIALLGLAVILFFKSSLLATKFIWTISDGGTRLFPLVSIAALVDSINPCAFSILLLTIGFLFSIGILDRNKMLEIGGAYIFGIFVAYLAIGVGILGALHLFNVPHFMGKVGAVLLIGLGIINLLNHFFSAFPIKLQIPRIFHAKMADLMGKTSIPAVFLLGALVGLCEFPCTGGPYLTVLGLLHDAQTKLIGLGYLIWYNLLFVLPLVVVLFLATEEAVLEKVQDWKRTNLKMVKLISGLVMIGFGILIFYL